MTGWEVVTQELALPSQWQLGGGGDAIWSPPAPIHWRRPGFRDAGYYAGQTLEPVFAVTLLDGQGRFLPLEAHQHRWNPACLELLYTRPEVTVQERRTVLESDVFVSQWQLSHHGDSARDYWLVLWTRRRVDDRQSVVDIEANTQGISFLETHSRHRFGCAIGSSFDAESWSVSHARVGGFDLDWPSTPFVQVMTRTGLPGLLAPPTEQASDGCLFFALAYPLTVPPGDKVKVNFFAALAPDAEAARANLEESVGLIDPVHTSEEEWIAWFEDVPSFESSDRMMQRAYWYWWAQRRLWQRALRPEIDPTRSSMDAGSEIEGVWRLSREELLSSFSELMDRDAEAMTEFPTALVLRRLLAHQPDDDLAEELSAHAARLRSFVHTALCEPNSLTDDVARPASLLRRRALALHLVDTLTTLEESSGARTQTPALATLRARLMSEIQEDHWSEESGWFVDQLEGSEESRRARTIHGLLTILVEAAREDQAERMIERVYDPEEFWTAPPLPSVSRDDLSFRPSTEGIDQLDGRICPGLVSLAIEALGVRIEQKSPRDRLLLAELVRCAVRTLFVEGDFERPACYDSYHPIGGYPSTMLGPSPPTGWLADHLLRFVAGIRPGGSGQVIIDPLPSGIEWFRIERVMIGEHEFEIEWDQRSGLSLRIDGQPAGHAPVGRSLSVNLAGASLTCGPRVRRTLST